MSYPKPDDEGFGRSGERQGQAGNKGYRVKGQRLKPGGFNLSSQSSRSKRARRTDRTTALWEIFATLRIGMDYGRASDMHFTWFSDPTTGIPRAVGGQKPT